ncbi:hypothetical protein TanjilG_02504 [Lupinus angustifolius]|uniref:Uncharacterized protein n=1 Tax=Lupinus angustifolius TaxID=3871 RepID=A0A1J7HWC8_LUPAN|nr:hypothetical protein TanjilG_02504 [Lupinus angustifolius]
MYRELRGPKDRVIWRNLSYANIARPPCSVYPMVGLPTKTSDERQASQIWHYNRWTLCSLQFR